MTNHLEDPDTHVWPINFPTGDIRPPRARDARTGTDFDPDRDSSEDARPPRHAPPSGQPAEPPPTPRTTTAHPDREGAVVVPGRGPAVAVCPLQHDPQLWDLKVRMTTDAQAA